MNKLVKRLLTGTLAFATILTALPVTAVHGRELLRIENDPNLSHLLETDGE